MEPDSLEENKIFRREGSAIRLRVHASPGASRDRVLGPHGNALKIAVRAPPERGKANSAIRKVLARTLGLQPSRVTLEKGEFSREKVFCLEGIPLEDLEARLEKLLRNS